MQLLLMHYEVYGFFICNVTALSIHDLYQINSHTTTNQLLMVWAPAICVPFFQEENRSFFITITELMHNKIMLPTQNHLHNGVVNAPRWWFLSYGVCLVTGRVLWISWESQLCRVIKCSVSHNYPLSPGSRQYLHWLWCIGCSLYSFQWIKRKFIIIGVYFFLLLIYRSISVSWKAFCCLYCHLHGKKLIVQ